MHGAIELACEHVQGETGREELERGGRISCPDLCLVCGGLGATVRAGVFVACFSSLVD